ncbi:trypsin-like serine protease [Streptomyces sp. ISL-66]|uniref:trypsin-like serine protease n=1 Tax=Streptomyces sp. ISL-66 TaxID=2819186 RepID=UPI001BEAD7DF|nr:trypsin-like serine protease [Streptomyces sp. ISL-66]MBT2472556.1 trypsin-like serine protease [Streptomyces sp. ISL-66]
MRIRRWLPAAALTAAVTAASPAPLASAEPAPVAAPYAVEDGSYPYRSEILEAFGVDLIAGDGNITHTSCSGPYQILVWAANMKTSGGTICFKAASTGFLSVNIPNAYRIETMGRDIQASISIGGQGQTLHIPKDTSKGFGKGSSTDSPQAVLLEMRVTGSGTAAPQPPAGANPMAFTGKLKIGDMRSCTATLVDPRWVITAKNCFADKPNESIDIPASAPKKKTILTVGRADLATSGGHTSEVVELVPHADRDLVMARLAEPATTVTPVTVSSTAPTTGETLTAVGFGRTKTEWVPSKLHSATSTVGSLTPTSFPTTAETPPTPRSARATPAAPPCAPKTANPPSPASPAAPGRTAASAPMLLRPVPAPSLPAPTISGNGSI